MEQANTRRMQATGVPLPAMGGGGGGGVGSPPRRFPPSSQAGARLRLLPAAAVLAGLPALLAAPPPAPAQTCSPTGYTGTLPTVTYAGTYTAGIDCHTLTNGLEMTLGPNLKIGTEASPLASRAIHIDAEGDNTGDKHVVVRGSGMMYVDESGLNMQRDGTGLLQLEFTAGKIVSGGTEEGVGIYLWHQGEANRESQGIRLVSGADIDLSAHEDFAKEGIHAETIDAPATATIPITIQVTGGTIDVSDPASSTLAEEAEGGTAIKVEQYVKGDIAITVESAARLGTAQAIAGAHGIYAELKPDSEGNIMITHRGQIYAGDGISVGSAATSAQKGHITITTAAGSVIVAKEFKEYSGIYEYGIFARIGEASSTGDVTITHQGDLTADGRGIEAVNEGTGGVTVTTGTGSQISAGDGEPGMRAALGSTSTGDITITHHGALTAGGNGIEAEHQGTGGMTVTTGTGSQITADSDGIQASLDAAGNITITHHGAIEAGRIGIFTYNNGTGDVTVTTGPSSQIVARGDAAGSSGINASVRSSAATGDVTVTHGGEIVAKEEGIYVSNRNTSDKGTGAIRVTTTAGSKVTAEKQGILVWHRGTGQASVTIRGTVMGDNAYISGSETTYAGVHIQVKDTDTRAGGGGEIVLGPMAHLSAKSGTAIKIDERAGAVTVILEEDQDGLAGHLEGKILSAGEGLSAGTVLSKTTEDAGTTMMFKARAGETGTERTLSVGDSVNMRGETQGIYDKVYRTQLMRITGGHEFKKLSETRLYHDRTRVYEALPAVLLDLNGQLPYQERMAAPRDGDGLWARLAAGDGARRPARSTTARGFTGRALAWDVAQYGFEGGLDFRPAATERLLLGVSLHARQGTATVAHGGTIEVSGFGGGGAATYRDAAGFYLDGRFSYTYFDDVDLTSRTRGAVQADLSGHGYALGLEAGKRLGWEGLDHVALTPRARVVWSTVKLEDFADLAGSGRVALETATSLKGRLGLLAETAFGGATLKDWTGDGGRLFGSLDVEHEFLVDRETRASGTALASEVQATWGRVGLGGTLIWHDGLTLSGEGFYATAGSDNTDFGGSLTLTLRF